jgi:hypothetical protein
VGKPVHLDQLETQFPQELRAEGCRYDHRVNIFIFDDRPERLHEHALVVERLRGDIYGVYRRAVGWNDCFDPLSRRCRQGIHF